RNRHLGGFLWHFVAFLAVMFFLGFPSWGVFWGIGLLAHAVGTVRVLWRVTERQAPAAVVAVEEVEAEAPFLADLRRTLAKLEESGEPVDHLRDDATRLHRDRAALDAALEGVDLPALRSELEGAWQRAAQATRETDREAFGRQAAAVEERLDVLEDALAARDRLVARESELLHQLNGLLLARVQHQQDASSAATDAGERLARVRETLRADAEVEESLARARQAARKQRT
ncbi:MAG: hypothetical protein JRI25_06155, partial [Deltaproteobacteria bacterium]|nr:hypothetical protein [Deltaproteobacteria bacterium]